MAGYLTPDDAISFADAGKDLLEEDVEDVFGGKVRIRALTAAQNARIRQQAMNFGGPTAKIDWTEMERLQFRYGVIEPKLEADQVKRLHIKSGPSFAKVIKAIDDLSGTDKEALRKAEAEFPEPESDGE